MRKLYPVCQYENQADEFFSKGSFWLVIFKHVKEQSDSAAQCDAFSSGFTWDFMNMFHYISQPRPTFLPTCLIYVLLIIRAKWMFWDRAAVSFRRAHNWWLKILFTLASLVIKPPVFHSQILSATCIYPRRTIRKGKN